MYVMFGDEVLGYLEYVCFDGNIICFGLLIVCYFSEVWFNEIIWFYEENGCLIFNLYWYMLEEGGMK